MSQAKLIEIDEAILEADCQEEEDHLYVLRSRVYFAMVLDGSWYEVGVDG